MCPNECPGLQDCWGEAFDKLYERYLAASILVYAQLKAHQDSKPAGRDVLWCRFYIVDLDKRVLKEYQNGFRVDVIHGLSIRKYFCQY